MANSWLIILAVLLVVAAIVLAIVITKLRKQKVLLLVQSHEIEKQIRELKVQNQVQADLNRQKQQLIMLVSHDLKGPFNRIFALTQLLEMSPGNFTDEQKEYLNKMYQIVGDGLNMVRNIVDVRKIEEKGLEPYPEKFNLPQVISPLIKQYHVLADKKHIQIDYQTPEKIEMVGDKNYISRIMENLLSNALKFSQPEKKVTVSISTSGSHVIIAVQDEGPGLNSDDLANLYQKFKKLTPRPTGGESSQGLGLSIVKQLVTCMNGDVKCDTVLQQGSTFTVTLPLVLTLQKKI